MDPQKYQEIRPLVPEEVPSAIEELLDNQELRAVYESFAGQPSWDELRVALKSCQTVEDFKRIFSYHLVYFVANKSTKSLTLSGAEHLDPKGAYTYVSNHRDIILDGAFANVLLHDAGLKFPQIAIGDNLLVRPWVEGLVKLNGSFLVRRNLEGRRVLLEAKQLSGYMHEAHQGGASLWIAQREGRAKDSNDRTQSSVLKMLSIGYDRADVLTSLKALNIVPLSCSYEYDPCDYLKAREMQLKRDQPEYKKTAQEDALNMSTGVLGYKGRVHLALGRPLQEILIGQDVELLPEAERISRIADLIDREIHSLYALYAVNYIAWDMLTGSSAWSDMYTEKKREAFITYLDEQISRIKMPEGVVRDDAFLRERMLEMYANPAINHHAL